MGKDSLKKSPTTKNKNRDEEITYIHCLDVNQKINTKERSIK